MINTLCGSMGSLKSSEVGSLGTFKSSGNHCSIRNGNNASLTVKGPDDQKNNTSSSISISISIDQIPIQAKMDTGIIPPQDHHQQQQQAGTVENNNHSTAAAEHSLWEFFADQLEGDFMASSPVRNLPPVQSHPSSSCFVNHHDHNHQYCIDNDDDGGDHSLINYDDDHHPIPMGCSPCRSPTATQSITMPLSSPLRSPLSQPYNSATNNINIYGGGDKGGNNNMKGMSPIHRVLMNSPTNQYMEIESLSLPALEFLDDLDKDVDAAGGIASSQDCFDFSSVPELLECLIIPDTSAANSRFCGSHLSSTQESSSNNDTTSVSYSMNPSSNGAPLLQQLQQERQHEKQQQRKQQKQQHHHHQTHQLHQHQHQHQNMTGTTLMVPLSFGPEQEQDSGLRLVHLLLACAEAVAKEDYMLARRYLHHLNRVVTPLGDSMQRVASCFAEALGARLAATLTAASKPNISPTTATSSSSSTAPKPFTPFPPNSLEILKIYQIIYQACPYIKFAHFTANQAIFEAFEAEERVHVIDLDILQGYQWPAFMQALSARPGGAPFLRITGVGPSSECVRETGRCLTELAHSLHIPFEFHPVAEQLEDLKPHMFNRRVGEALAVNSVNRLHRMPTNSLGNLLGMIRDQAPNVVTIVEQEASHNGPYFLGRFLEALHYYSAIFDSLDATFPPDSAQRAKVEQYIFAPEIRNIVAHEGLDRTARHERLDKWRKIMEGKGFKGIPLSTNAVTQSKILLGLYSCDGYRLTEDKGCLLLGWQDRAILAASAWRC